MKMMVLIIIVSINVIVLNAQSVKKIPIEQGEKWYGGAVNEGEKMPFANGYIINLNGDTRLIRLRPYYYQLKEDISGAIHLLHSRLKIMKLHCLNFLTASLLKRMVIA